MLLSILKLKSGLSQGIEILLAAAVKARQFLGVQFDKNIVNIQGRNSRQAMFRGLNISIAAANRRSAVTLNDVFGLHPDLHRRVKIRTHKNDPRI